MRYSWNQKYPLIAFLEHGEALISNSLAENAIHPFVVGRKNWLFCNTVNGTESSAIVYSLVETARASGIDPYDYLLYTLSVIPYYGKSPSREKLDILITWSLEVETGKGCG